MNAHTASINLDQLIRAEPIQPASGLKALSKVFLYIGIVTFGIALIVSPKPLFWGAYYTNLVFFMGLACGSVVLTAIFQIVRAKWAPPVRRIAEAGVSFLPWAYIGFLISYFGKEHLFYWGTHTMGGREVWMQPDFVYLRFAFLLGFLFLVLSRFVRLSLRGDVGMIRERAKDLDRWFNPAYDGLVKNWQGLDKEVLAVNRTMSFRAPLVILAYAVIYSLFAFEMIMAMNEAWVSNMFGGYIFVTNIYCALAVLVLTVVYLTRRSHEYAGLVSSQQMWDVGKLTFGFCMLWGYLFFSQFMVQWYGNLPEETQWMILRTREMPWKALGWLTFAMCFVVPFITLLSRDVKRTPRAFVIVALIIASGIWLDRYVLIMPEMSPSTIPFGLLEVGMFLGFLGAYLLSVQNFIAKYPFIPVSSPLTRGSTDW